MNEQLINALNVIDAFFGTLNDDSTDADVGTAVFVSNHLDMVQRNFIEKIVKPRIHKQVIVDVNAKA